MELLKNQPFGPLEIKTTLFYCEEPHTFICTNRFNNLFLCLLIDTNKREYLLTCIDQDIFDLLTKENLDIYESSLEKYLDVINVFKEAKEGTVIKITKGRSIIINKEELFKEID